MARRRNLGRLVWQITGDSTLLKKEIRNTNKLLQRLNKGLLDFNKNIDKQFDGTSKQAKKTNEEVKKTESSFSKLGKTIKVAFAVGAVVGFGKAIANISKELINAASDAVEIQNKFDVVFKGIEDGAESATNTLVDGFGFARSEAQKLLSGNADIVQGFGATKTASLELSSEVAKLAADMASFNNIPIEQANRAIISSFTGEREALKGVGVVLTEADVKTQMLIDRQNGLRFENELLAKSAASLTLIQKQSANSIGDFARSSDSLANQQKVLRARFKDVREELGEDLIPVALDFVDAGKSMIPVISALGKVLTTILTPIGKAVKGIASFVSSLTVRGRNKQAIDGFKSSLSDVKRSIDEIYKLTEESTALDDLISQYDTLSTKASLTAEENETLKDVISDIAKIAPDAVIAVDAYGNAIDVSSEKAKNAAEQNLRLRKALLEEAKARLFAANVEAEIFLKTKGETIRLLRLEQLELAKKTKATFADYLIAKKAQEDLDSIGKGFRKSKEKEAKAQEILNRFIRDGVISQESYNRILNNLPANIKRLTPQASTLSRVLKILNDNYSDNQEALDKVNDKLGENAEEFENATKIAEEYSKTMGEIEGIEAALKAISDLNFEVSGGAAPELTRMEKLAEIIKNIKGQFSETDQIKAFTKVLEAMGFTAEEVAKALQNAGIATKELIDASGVVETEVTGAADKSSEKWEEFKENFKGVAEDFEAFGQEIGQGLISLFGSIASLSEAATEALLEDIDRRLQAELMAAGVAEETAIEKAEKEVEEAKKSGDEQAIAQAETNLKRAQIEDKYQREKAEAEYKGAMAAYALNVATAFAAIPLVITQALIGSLAFGPIVAGVVTGIAGATATANAIAVAARPPKKPSFQDGGIVGGNSYTGDKIEANLNSREAVFTLEDQKAMFDAIRGGGLGGATQYMTINFIRDGRREAQEVVKFINNGSVTIKANRGLS